MAQQFCRKAIRTRYLGATNTKPARIIATTEPRKVTLSYDHGLDSVDNHRAAAERLAAELNWSGVLVGGYFENDMYWVFS